MLAIVSIISLRCLGSPSPAGATAESKVFLVLPVLRLQPDELSALGVWRKWHSELPSIDTNYHESLSTRIIINTSHQIACAHRAHKESAFTGAWQRL